MSKSNPSTSTASPFGPSNGRGSPLLTHAEVCGPKAPHRNSAKDVPLAAPVSWYVFGPPPRDKMIFFLYVAWQTGISALMLGHSDCSEFCDG